MFGVYILKINIYQFQSLLNVDNNFSSIESTSTEAFFFDNRSHLTKIDKYRLNVVFSIIQSTFYSDSAGKVVFRLSKPNQLRKCYIFPKSINIDLQKLSFGIIRFRVTKLC